jgi:hypothetical protein
MEHLLADMKTYSIDKVVISHVVYYGSDNSYPAHCIKCHPDKFAGIGLLVGEGMHDPADPANPARLALNGRRRPYFLHHPVYFRSVRVVIVI